MSAQAFPARFKPGPPARRPDVGTPLGIAVLCVAGLAVVWVLAALVPATHVRDAVLLHDFANLNGPRVGPPLRFLLHLIDPLLFVLWAFALTATALAQERPRVALAVASVMGLAPLSAELLKPLAAHPHADVGSFTLGAASWPSGHSTAALALVLCAVLVARGRWRPWVALLGAAYVVGVSIALMVLAWHMPSDVLGGFLVAGLWMALALAALRAAERRWPTARSSAAAAAVPAP